MNRNTGFSLIELLVVIALIAILAAILFPAMMVARASGQTTRCLAHERELLGSLHMYTQDWGGRLPNSCYLTYSRTSRGLVGPYLPYVKNTQILICQKLGSYGYNRLLTGRLGWKMPYMPGFGSDTADLKDNIDSAGRQLDSIPDQRRVMAIICVLPASSIAEDPANPNHVIVDPPRGHEWEPHDLGGEYAVRMANRHRGGTTYGFLDGHSRWLSPTGIKEGFPVATYGIDYDGNGTWGTANYMR